MKVVVGETIDAWMLLLVVVQLVTLFLLIGQNGKIRRLESLLRDSSRSSRSRRGQSQEAPEVAPELSEFEQKQAEVKEQKDEFKRFLEADPSRKLLAKKEQFAAYRQWRAEQGLTWSADPKE